VPWSIIFRLLAGILIWFHDLGCQNWNGDGFSLKWIRLLVLVAVAAHRWRWGTAPCATAPREHCFWAPSTLIIILLTIFQMSFVQLNFVQFLGIFKTEITVFNGWNGALKLRTGPTMGCIEAFCQLSNSAIDQYLTMQYLIFIILMSR